MPDDVHSRWPGRTLARWLAAVVAVAAAGPALAATPVTATLGASSAGASMNGTLRFDLDGGPVEGTVTLDVATASPPPAREDGSAVPGRLALQVTIRGTYAGGPYGRLEGTAVLAGTLTDDAGCRARLSGTGTASGSVSAPLGLADVAADWAAVAYEGCRLRSSQPSALALPPFNFTPVTPGLRVAAAPPSPPSAPPAPAAPPGGPPSAVPTTPTPPPPGAAPPTGPGAPPGPGWAPGASAPSPFGRRADITEVRPRVGPLPLGEGRLERSGSAYVIVSSAGYGTWQSIARETATEFYAAVRVRVERGVGRSARAGLLVLAPPYGETQESNVFFGKDESLGLIVSRYEGGGWVAIPVPPHPFKPAVAGDVDWFEVTKRGRQYEFKLNGGRVATWEAPTMQAMRVTVYADIGNRAEFYDWRVERPE